MAMAVIEPNSIPEGLAFDDVLLRPGLSAVMPSGTNIGTQLTRAIRRNDGEALFEHFTRTRAIRRGIVETGQDSAAPDFGRPHEQLTKKP